MNKMLKKGEMVSLATGLTRPSREEAESIIRLAPKEDGFLALDFKASRETAMSPEMSKYRIVHFATHGVLATQSWSTLALASARAIRPLSPPADFAQASVSR